MPIVGVNVGQSSVARVQGREFEMAKKKSKKKDKKGKKKSKKK